MISLNLAYCAENKNSKGDLSDRFLLNTVKILYLAPPSTIFQLYRGGQFYCEEIIDMPQVTDKLDKSCNEYTSPKS
jgi:hypothetical protein